MILDEIVAHKRTEVAGQQQAVSLEALQERIENVAAPRDFRAVLRKRGISLIAEIKRASPSRGDLLPELDALALATLYEQAGARAISILTDMKYFKGSIEDLTAVHRSCALPCLRKEFVVDPYQIYEARAAGADAVLLIVRILNEKELADFLRLVLELGMAALVEAHDEEEIKRALGAGAHIIGINNRDLDTLEVRLETTLELKKLVPGGKILVSESGIHDPRQVKRLEDGGVDAILVGESLLTSRDISAKIRELMAESSAVRWGSYVHDD